MNLLIKFNCVREDGPYRENRKLLNIEKRNSVFQRGKGIVIGSCSNCKWNYDCDRGWTMPDDRYKNSIELLNRLQKKGMNI